MGHLIWSYGASIRRHVNRTMMILLLPLSVLFGVANAAPPSTAQPEKPADEASALDDILQGFEDGQPGAQDPAIDAILDGFETDQTPEPADDHIPQEKRLPITLDGYLKIGATWNFAHEAPDSGEIDWRGLSRLRPETRLDLQARITEHWRMLMSAKAFYDFAYTLKGRDEFNDAVLDQYEQEAELGEAFLQGRLASWLDLKAGRQIVVWGRSDNIRVTDVLNPLDIREPGMTDIEDLRLPVTMTRMDAYWGPWNLSALAVHEIRFDKTPVIGHDFFPSETSLPAEEDLGWGGDNTEWALALNGIFSGKDLSLYWADLYDDDAYVATAPGFDLVRKHARLTIWGAAGNLVLGNWILIGEAAYLDGLKFFNAQNHSFERLDGLLGVEYSGWHDTTVALDWAIRRIIDFDHRTKAAPDYAQQEAFQYAARLSRDFFNDTLNVTLLAMVYGPLGQDGALERFTIEYDWSDALCLKLGFVLYQSGDRYDLNNIGDNDRVFAEIKYSF